MDELLQIKTRIYNEDKIDELLELLGCWNIDTEQHGLLYVAGLPDGDNPRSVQIKNTESLTCNVRSKGITGSIYDLVGFIVFDAKTEKERTENIHKSKMWICEQLKYYEFIDAFYKETSDYEFVKPNINAWLHKLKGNKKKKVVVVNDPYELKELNRYGSVAYQKWIDEGLSVSTQLKFGVGIDIYSERITFPIHDKWGNFIGVKGRYCGKNKEIEDNYKYLYLLKCNKSIELYNLHRAIPHIQATKEVIIVEGAKTTWYLTQWGYPNCVSIEGDSLSDIQVNLLKELGMDIKYTFVYDKDKDSEFVKQEASKLNGRMKFGVMDLANKLEAKDSPTDQGLEIWKYNYENNKYRI